MRAQCALLLLAAAAAQEPIDVSALLHDQQRFHERVATAKCKVAGRGQPTQGWTQHVSLADGAAHA